MEARMNISKVLVVPALGLALNGSASAALPFGEMSFVERVATVAATDAIDVRIRFTLDAASSPLVFNFGALPSVYDLADLPKQGNYLDPATQTLVRADFARYIRAGAGILTRLDCDQTFVYHSFCNSPGPDSYTYTTLRSVIQSVPSFSLQPGGIYEDTLLRFDPKNGAASPGTYRFHEISLYLYFDGYTAGGQFIQSDPVYLGTTCASHLDGCAFTRTVPVSEPATVATMLAGLGLMGLSVLARRRSQTA
jgi:hypothetical protein